MDDMILGRENGITKKNILNLVVIVLSFIANIFNTIILTTHHILPHYIGVSNIIIYIVNYATLIYLYKNIYYLITNVTLFTVYILITTTLNLMLIMPINNILLIINGDSIRYIYASALIIMFLTLKLYSAMMLFIIRLR